MTKPIDSVLLISPLDMFRAYGLRLVSAHLRRNGIRTKMLFLPAYTEIWKAFYHQEFAAYPEKVLDQAAELAAGSDLVGISMTTLDRPRVAGLAERFMKAGKPVMLGGIHPTIDPEDALRLTGLANIGEGYDSLVEFCREPDNDAIRNIARLSGGRAIINPVRPAVENIDSLPFPDFSAEDHYVLLNGRIRPLTGELQARFIGAVYHQFATLGCPFACSYCVNSNFGKLGKGYERLRSHSADYIVEEAIRAKSLSPKIRHINFADDGFIAMPEKTIEEFSLKYRKLVGLPFSVVGVIPEFVTRRKIELLAEAGLKRVTVGLQSANAEALKSYNRPGDPEGYERVHDLFRERRDMVAPYYDIIMDNPFVDREKDLLDTIGKLRRFKGNFNLLLFSLRLYPKTELHDKAAALGLPERYYSASFVDYDKRLLDYILTVMQAVNSPLAVSALLWLYRKKGNIRVPGFLFTVNRVLWMAGCGLQHVLKNDMSGLPYPVVALVSPVHKALAAFKRVPRPGPAG